MASFEADVCEALLFHGSRPAACFSICQSDFMVNLAGSHKGTLYGPGVYLAEMSSKSDEYGEIETQGENKGLYAMLLCRSTCGHVLYDDALTPDTQELLKSCTGVAPKYHSVLGDREKTRGTYREFVIYNNDQVYPEYVILYTREAKERSGIL